MAANFTITDIRLFNVQYSVAPVEGKTQEAAVQVNFNFESFHDEQKRLFRTVLGTQIRGETAPYSLDVQFIGTFMLDAAPDQQEEERLVSIVFPTILFPYLRECVSDITKRAGHSPLYIQPVNFSNARLQRSTSGNVPGDAQTYHINN